jgi:hypothetical protein
VELIVGEGFCLWWNSSRLSLQREVAIVLFIAIAPNTFLRGVPITPSMISSALDGRRGFVWCEFLTVGATPSTASCELAWIASSRHIYGPPRVDPYGRDLELPGGNSDRTTADESELLWCLLFVSNCCSRELVKPLRRRPRIGPSPLSRVDVRAEARGAAPLSSLSGGSPRACWFMRSQIHGTRHTSFVSSACAR